MSVDVHEEADGRVLVVKVSGQLTKEDYERFVPNIDRLIVQHGHLRILLYLHAFHGWTTGALWRDTQFAWKHFSDIQRLAVVGEKAWQHGMAAFCKPFTSATVQYFDRADAGKAEVWVRADLAFEQMAESHST
jgi:SpoIIAA-like